MIHLQDRHVERREHLPGSAVESRIAEIGVAHHEFGEGVVLEFVEQVEALGARQVVEPVGILQVLHRHLEDEAEGRAQHAAERHLLFGEAADPEVDGVQAAERAAGIGAGAR